MVALLVAAAVYFIYPVGKSTKLGLDLQGGIHVVLQAVGTAKAPVTQEAMDRAENVLRNRVDRLGVAEPQIERQGQDHFLVQLPGIRNPDEALKIIGQTALLEFAIVEKNYEGLSDADLNEAKGEGEKVVGPTLLTGDALSDAFVSFDPQTGAPIVNFSLKRTGSKTFADITRKNVQKRLAIILDGSIISAPTIQSAITGGQGI